MNAVTQNNDNTQWSKDKNKPNNQIFEGHWYERWFDNRHGGYGGRGRLSENHYNWACRPIQCFTCYKEGHRYADCPYKDRTDLKLCTSCGVGDHSLEDFPTMIDKINKKKNVNVLSCIQKHDIINTNNLHIVTQQGTKIGNDNPRISKIKEKNDYPDPIKQKQLYKDATNVFREFSR